MTFKVLLVDDNPIVLQAFGLALGRDGFDVDTAENAEVAADMVESNDYDAVVSDLRMPGRDGFWLLGHVKALSRKTYCVLMSGDPDVTRSRVEAMPEVDLFLEKPVNRATLRDALRSEQKHRQAAG